MSFLSSVSPLPSQGLKLLIMCLGRQADSAVNVVALNESGSEGRRWGTVPLRG